MEDLDYWIAVFVLEVKKSDGSYHTFGLLRNLMAGIGHQLRQVLGERAQCLDAILPRLTNALDHQEIPQTGWCGEMALTGMLDIAVENRLWDLLTPQKVI